jgi:glycosyltransferase involved in cell wall biosynthesis
MISILLATYNGEKYIKESVSSILNQTFKDFELLVGLNGTNDSSIDILNSFNDDRIKIFNYEEKGKSKTLNKLLSESKFDIICVQDDDDIWMDNKLEKQIQFIGGRDVVGTFINYIDENGIIINDNLYFSTSDESIKNTCLSGLNQIANSSSMIRKQSCIEVGGWREELDDYSDRGYQPLEDYDLWLRMIKIGKVFLNIPEKLVHHRVHQNSKFNTKILDMKIIFN